MYKKYSKYKSLYIVHNYAQNYEKLHMIRFDFDWPFP